MNQTIQWLLEGDVSLHYLTHRYLLGSSEDALLQLQGRIESEGFGSEILAKRNENGHWGLWYYQPKWTSTHYTLMDLKLLGVRSSQPSCREMVIRALHQCQLSSGGLNFAKSSLPSDIAVDGMFLNYGSYFCPEETIRLSSVVSHVLIHQKPDGGFSWDYAATVGDPHTTLCVLEGLHAFATCVERPSNYQTVQSAALKYLYAHNLFINGDKRYTKLAYPYRYRYDLLRFLDYAVDASVPNNSTIERALAWLEGKRDGDTWNLELIHPGAVHVAFEQVHERSRFITLKALRVLKHYRLLSGH